MTGLPGLKVAHYGLGAMGWPIAQRLLQAGCEVLAFDTHADTQLRWDSGHLMHGKSPDNAPGLHQAQVVLVCVSDEAASRQVWAQALPKWAPGALVIELGTVSQAWALQAAALCEGGGLRYADAPLSGGVAGAQAGEMVAMLGARPADVDPARAALAAFTAKVLHMGPPGAGQLCKMAHQLALAGVAAGLAQAQSFSREAGLDFAQVLEVLSLGTAASAQLSRLRDTLAQRDNTAADSFAWLQKDLAHCQQASPSPLPLVALWQTLWQPPAALSTQYTTSPAP